MRIPENKEEFYSRVAFGALAPIAVYLGTHIIKDIIPPISESQYFLRDLFEYSQTIATGYTAKRALRRAANDSSNHPNEPVNNLDSKGLERLVDGVTMGATSAAYFQDLVNSELLNNSENLIHIAKWLKYHYHIGREAVFFIGGVTGAYFDHAISSFKAVFGRNR